MLPGTIQCIFATFFFTTSKMQVRIPEGPSGSWHSFECNQWEIPRGIHSELVALLVQMVVRSEGREPRCVFSFSSEAWVKSSSWFLHVHHGWCSCLHSQYANKMKELCERIICSKFRAKGWKNDKPFVSYCTFHCNNKNSSCNNH